MSIYKKVYISLLVLFLIAFPKGGFKVGDVPITWGYLLLAFTFFLICAKILIKCQFSISLNRLLVYGATLPFQFYSVFIFSVNGVSNAGFFIALLTNFIFFPLFFIILTGQYYDRVDLNFTFKAIKNAVFFIAVYGIILFVIKLVTRKFIEIPYLTINADDKGMLDYKFINRGLLFKLISTYNNGNIYGVSVLMLLPLYNRIEKSFLKKVPVYASLILTLSRTVWIGLVICQVFVLLSKKISPKTIVMLLASFVVVGISIGYIISYLNYDMKFLLDKNLGGRATQLVSLKNIELISSHKFSIIAEIVYVSVLEHFGIVGLIFFLATMLMPLLLYHLGLIRYKKSKTKKALYQGLLLYLIVSCSDGAILYIPVMAFYWMITGFLLSKNLYFEQEIQLNKPQRVIKPANAEANLLLSEH